jgi:hypothetical protein
MTHADLEKSEPNYLVWFAGVHIGGVLMDSPNKPERNARGELLPGHRIGTRTRFTPETARLGHQARAEKAARLMREEIANRARVTLQRPVSTALEALAIAGGMLFEQIVLNPEARARDRRETLETVGKIARVILPEERGTLILPPAEGRNRLADLPVGVLDVLRDVLVKVQERRSAMEAQVTDSPPALMVPATSSLPRLSADAGNNREDGPGPLA